MASPKSMFSGAISLGMVTLPITIGKATGDTREGSLVEVCDHRAEANEVIRIDKSERCSRCGGSPTRKTHAVKVGDGDYRVLDENEWIGIEDATKSDLLEILDVQPLNQLPMMYAIGTYYVRFNTNAKGATDDAFAHFVAALHKMRAGAIVKWGNSSRQKLCVLHVESGILLLRIIPFVTDIRVASKQERGHWHVELEERKLDKMTEFLTEVRDRDGFQYASYADEGLRLRQEAVEAVLAGEEPKQLHQHDEGESPADWMDKLEQQLQLTKS